MENRAQATISGHRVPRLHSDGQAGERQVTTKHSILAHIAELVRRLAGLKARLPAHTIPPSMIAEMDELEDALLEAQGQLEAKRTCPPPAEPPEGTFVD